jgi:hypothetical protein
MSRKYREGREENEGGETAGLEELGERERAIQISNRRAKCSNGWTDKKVTEIRIKHSYNIRKEIYIHFLQKHMNYVQNIHKYINQCYMNRLLVRKGEVKTKLQYDRWITREIGGLILAALMLS